MFSKELVKNSIHDGWAAFKLRPWPLVFMMAGLGLTCIVFQGMTAAVFGEKSWQANLSGIITQILFIVFYPGFQAYSLKAVRKSGPDWEDFFWGLKYPFRIFAADILSTLPILAALLVGGIALVLVNLLKLPDSIILFKYVTMGVIGAQLIWVLVYLSIRFNQWSLLLIDKHVTAVESVKQSWALMRGYSLSFFVLLVIVALMNLLGAMALLVGLFVSVPVSLAAFSAFYLRISDEKVAR